MAVPTIARPSQVSRASVRPPLRRRVRLLGLLVGLLRLGRDGRCGQRLLRGPPYCERRPSRLQARPAARTFSELRVRIVGSAAVPRVILPSLLCRFSCRSSPCGPPHCYGLVSYRLGECVTRTAELLSTAPRDNARRNFSGHSDARALRQRCAHHNAARLFPQSRLIRRRQSCRDRLN